MRAPIALLLGLASCAGMPLRPSHGPEALSLLGAPLARIEPHGALLAHYQAELERSRSLWEESFGEEEAIWVGRNLAYLGRYQEAIRWYSRRLLDFPLSARLRRHRGHRYLSTRQVDRAVADLSYAWRLLEGTEDQVEPDGAPNRYGLPRSTTHTNVLYHLGLAHYLRGEWGTAVEVFGECLARCTNDDMRVATMNWLVHALRRNGQHAQAQEVLDGVTRRMEVLENNTYHQLLLLQKGKLLPRDLLRGSEDGVLSATALYGIATWSHCNGNRSRAEALWREVVGQTPWNAFGHLCAESDLAR